MSELRRIQEWYAAQCDGAWEHRYGVKIDTLDNPGWRVDIDLSDTELQLERFVAFSRGDPEHDADWIRCSVESGTFSAVGGSGNLTELLQIFLTWAATVDPV